MRNNCLFILMIFILSSCHKEFDKEYYEKVTDVRFDFKYRVLETVDNGEWLTATVFKVDKPVLIDFIEKYHMDTSATDFELNFFSRPFLENNKADFKSPGNIYFVKHSKGKINWNCIADMNTNRLWVEISYPDHSGD
jgi:hypothetical protein